jgi:hypothetical protein
MSLWVSSRPKPDQYVTSSADAPNEIVVLGTDLSRGIIAAEAGRAGGRRTRGEAVTAEGVGYPSTRCPNRTPSTFSPIRISRSGGPSSAGAGAG